MQVYQLSIGAACGLSWPSDRIIIQVLDDSTDPTIKVTPKKKKQSLKDNLSFTNKFSNDFNDLDFLAWKYIKK